MTDDMIKEHLARAHLAESVTMDAETWTEVLQELQQYRQTIHQAEQAKPVAWMVQYKDRHEFVWSEPKFLGDKAFVVPLYTIPPKREWVGMTDEEIENMMDYWSDDARSAYGGAHAANGEYVYIPDIIRYAEARLKEKNT